MRGRRGVIGQSLSASIICQYVLRESRSGSSRASCVLRLAQRQPRASDGPARHAEDVQLAHAPTCLRPAVPIAHPLHHRAATLLTSTLPRRYYWGWWLETQHHPAGTWTTIRATRVRFQHCFVRIRIAPFPLREARRMICILIRNLRTSRAAWASRLLARRSCLHTQGSSSFV